MSWDSSLLDIVCCPVTHLPLAPMPAAQLEKLNRLIGESKIKTREDGVLAEPLEAALVTRDGKLAYPIRDGIPVLIEEHGILLSQLEV